MGRTNNAGRGAELKTWPLKFAYEEHPSAFLTDTTEDQARAFRLAGTKSPPR
jgi:hypothetical protein